MRAAVIGSHTGHVVFKSDPRGHAVIRRVRVWVGKTDQQTEVFTTSVLASERFMRCDT